MKNSLLQMYYDLKESNATSDFPKLLANVMYKTLINKFKGVNSPWRQYTMRGTLSDFKPHNRVIMSEAPDLLLKEELGPYTDSTLEDFNYQIGLITKGRTFTVSREAIINDDLQALRRQPERFGRASARTLIKQIVNAIEGDGLMYDGKNMFHLDHGNSANVTLTNDAAGIAAVSAGMTVIEKSTDPTTGEKYGIEAKYLLVPPDLEDTAMRIVNGQNFYPVSTSGGTNEIGKAKRLTVLKEPFLTSTTGWYVMADPNDLPVIEVGFLNGKETPDLLIKRADTINLAGGEDEWGYEFDDISYKARYDYAVARAMYQGIYRGKA